MTTVAFHTLGCKVNQYETEAMTELFLSRGYTVVEYHHFADIYVINTCTVTNLGDKKSRQMIRRAKKQNPASIVIVVGCYAQIAPDEVMAIEGVNMVIGTNERHRIVELIEEYSDSTTPINTVTNIMDVKEFEELSIQHLKGHTRAYLKIQEGCNQFCSYCIIPYARGPIRSRKPEDVLNEVKKLVANGFKEIVLTGIHVASYGKDLENMNLLKILEMVHTISELERIRIGSIEPTVLTEDFLDGLSRLPKVCDHFHLSLQSGCDTVLKRMNRKYTTDLYAQSVQKLRQILPNVALTTDIIVGFPGETTEEFNMTYDFVRKIGFSQIHVFKYSPRDGTPAAKMIDQIAPTIKEERSRKMILLGKEMQHDFLNQHKGKVSRVLFEQRVPSKKPSSETYYEGYTSNYIRVLAPSDQDTHNMLLPVRMVEVEQDFITGQIIIA